MNYKDNQSEIGKLDDIEQSSSKKKTYNDKIDVSNGKSKDQ